MSRSASAHTDTPHKSGPIIQLSRKKMTAPNLHEDLMRDIHDTLQLVETQSFLTKIFPQETALIEKIFSTLKRSESYRDGRWAGFPAKEGQEDGLYAPFVKACNAIVSAIPRDKIETNIVYIDCHSSTPFSEICEMAATRPDGAGGDFGVEAMTQLGKDLIALELKTGMRTRLGEEKMKIAEEQLKEEKKKLLKAYDLWWYRMHNVYEIKSSAKAQEEAVKQLLRYMRQMLMEQLDRRFVIGFVLCYDQLTLVMCDRSGMMMTDTPININQEPEQFIRIIAGFSRMEPVDLGWDTGMKVYIPTTGKIVQSFLRDADKSTVNRYETHWVIDVVVNGQKEQYVSVGVISAIRAAEICSRATIVFEVIKFTERLNPEKTYALKRYWRPLDKDRELYPSEGDIYEMLEVKTNTKYIYASHDIMIGDMLDSTSKLIRKGLTVQASQKQPAKPLPRRNESDHDAENTHPHRHSEVSEIRPSVPEIVYRCHTNILMPKGMVIRCASSLKELLWCILCIIKDHKIAHRLLILHRDISSGNLLIFTDDNGGAYGRLMDYDHAKKAPKSKVIEPKNKDVSADRMTKQIKFTHILLEDTEFSVTDDTASLALQFTNDPYLAGKYAMSVAQSKEINNSRGPLSPNELEWVHEEKINEWPDFGNRDPRPGERTGTLCFMSGEVICSECFHTPPGYREPPLFQHEAIHDMESLLWVLVHICMTRKGLGEEMMRDELTEDKPIAKTSLIIGLRDAVLRYFDGEEDLLKQSKRQLAIHPSKFKAEIIDHFDPFFEPLNDLVEKWWAILILGYQWRGDEYYEIHDHLVRLVTTAHTNIDIATSPNQGMYDTAANRELDLRNHRRDKALNTFENFRT